MAPENPIHRIFEPVRPEIGIIVDRFGRPVAPCGWFLVPLLCPCSRSTQPSHRIKADQGRNDFRLCVRSAPGTVDTADTADKAGFRRVIWAKDAAKGYAPVSLSLRVAIAVSPRGVGVAQPEEGRPNVCMASEHHEAIESDLCLLAANVEICALRILLDTGRIRATVPMLRGVWGAALRELAPPVYDTVFEGRSTKGGSGADGAQAPLYVMRPAPPDPDTAPAFELLLFGSACRYVPVALDAVARAMTAGLGPRREPVRVKDVLAVSPDGRQTAVPRTWSVGEAEGFLSRDIAPGDPVRLEFIGPVRILRRGTLVRAPSFADLAVAGLRRLCVLSRSTGRSDLQARLLRAARGFPASAWHGCRRDLVRWSGRQQVEVTLHAVAGRLDLPKGPGPFRPLLSACRWVHIGKGTVFGLGQPDLWRRR